MSRDFIVQNRKDSRRRRKNKIKRKSVSIQILKRISDEEENRVCLFKF